MSKISDKTVSRLTRELKLIQKDPNPLLDTYPDENDLLTWYFLLRGPPETSYEGGFYMGKIMYPSDFPLRPPDIMMLTPSGRFDIGKKICLTNTGYHSESWSPIWNIGTLLIGFTSVFSDDKDTGISHIKDTPANRKKMATDSFNYNLKNYKKELAGFVRFVIFNDDGSIQRMKTKEELLKDDQELTEKIKQRELKKKLEDKPKLSDNKEPVKELAKEEPVKELAKEEPVKELAKEEPVKELAKEEPVKELAKDEPVKELVKDEPVKGKGKSKGKNNVSDNDDAVDDLVKEKVKPKRVYKKKEVNEDDPPKEKVKRVYKKKVVE